MKSNVKEMRRNIEERMVEVIRQGQDALRSDTPELQQVMGGELSRLVREFVRFTAQAADIYAEILSEIDTVFLDDDGAAKGADFTEYVQEITVKLEEVDAGVKAIREKVLQYSARTAKPGNC